MFGSNIAEQTTTRSQVGFTDGTISTNSENMKSMELLKMFDSAEVEGRCNFLPLLYYP